MAVSVYKINKGINKPIEFKGLKAQYIWYFGAIVVVLLIIYITLFLLGFNQYYALAIVGICGFFLTKKVSALSKKYGQHGLTKMLARKSIPKVIKCRDREIFKIKKVK